MKRRCWCGRGSDELSAARPRRTTSPYRRTSARVFAGCDLRSCAVGVFLFVCIQYEFVFSRGLGKCVSDGVEYSPGDRVRTADPCLECLCSEGGTVVHCRLRVCPRLPRPPPPSCLLLRRPNTCCERLVCSDGLQNTVQGRSNIESELQQTFHEGCILNGTVYGEGSAMVTSSLCEYCYCIKGKQHCVRPQCILSVTGCVPEYSKHSCCPVKYNCSKELASPSSTPPSTSGTCEVDGEEFPEGSRLGKMERRPCEKCYCLKGRVHCDPVVCELPPLSNCSPVIQEGHCCPISYNCSSSLPVVTTEQDQGQIQTTLIPHELLEETTTLFSPTPTEGDPSLIESTTFDSGSMTEGASMGSAEERSITTTAVASLSDEATTTLVRQESVEMINSTETSIKLEEKRKVNPEVIEAIINRTLEKEDYDYDYNEPSLPPSLPNLKIIPFVAADAMIQKHEEDPLFAAELVSTKSTASPTLTFSPAMSHPAGFSPPTETEGGFLPREPVIDGPFYESKFIESSAVVGAAEASLPVITESPKILEKGSCEKNGKVYAHGEVIDEPSACNLCVCYFGSLHCRQPPCNGTDCTGKACGQEIKAATPASVLPEVLPQFPKEVTIAEIVVTPKPLGGDPLPVTPSSPTVTTTTISNSSTKNEFDYDDFSLGNMFDFIFSNHPSTKPALVKSPTPSTTPPTSTTSTASSLPPAIPTSPLLHDDPELNSIVYRETPALDRISLDHSNENLINSQSHPSSIDLQLKLAGCNIYGKMYQVGDFIAELSETCSKCECAESGVQCHKIDC